MIKLNQLVIGASGQVGAALVRELLKSDNWRVFGTFWSNPNTGTAKYFLDVTDKVGVDRMINTLRPVVVWLPAYFTNVEYAEKYRTVNVDGMLNVLQAAESVNARVVFYSSGYVFDGESGQPYRTDDIPNPINEYARQKLEVEKATLLGPRNTVIRTMGVYGVDEKRMNFAYRVLDTVASGETIYVPSDQWMNPITSDNLAEISVDLVTLSVHGILHIAGDHPVTKYQFAQDLVRNAGMGFKDKLIVPKTSDEMNQHALRPMWSVLDWKEIEKYGSRVKDYRKSIQEFVKIY